MLDNALDCGISEADFWNMTLAELDRLVRSKERTEKYRLKEKASLDYILAMLIGRAISSNEEHPFPEIHEVYPELFYEDFAKMQEEKEAKQAQLSAIRFIQFAESFNKNFDEEANE